MTQPTGSIFISHSIKDRKDVVDLGHALQAAIRDYAGIFNASDYAIRPGSRWREQIIAAIRDSSMVLLWATDNALASREVGFEIGAASALGKLVIPCCVHVAAESLPWSLNEIHALVLDKEDGWEQLATTVAARLNLTGNVDRLPLLRFASQIRATSPAVEVLTLGRTIEIRNNSPVTVSNIRIVSADSANVAPAWAVAFDDVELPPGVSTVTLRERDQEERQLRLSWVDADGLAYTRLVTVAPTQAGPVPAPPDARDTE